MTRHRTTARSILALLLLGVVAGSAEAGVPRLIFPVLAKVSYTDDFGDPRWQGSHQANDIMARKKSPVVAVEGGKVVKWTSSSSAGCMLYLYGRSGTTYMYIHLNNDRTMRNDNRGGCRNGIAYAPGLRSGQRVAAGRLIAYVGDSGDANGIASHLHFELHPNGGRAVSPYRRLRAARHHLYQRPSMTLKQLSLKIYGRVLAKNLDVRPRRLTLRVTGVGLSNGWWVRPARRVTLAVPSNADVQRRASGANHAASLWRARVGERALVWTQTFPQTLRYARARAGAIQAQAVLFRGM